jgi:hypothetical protein
MKPVDTRKLFATGVVGAVVSTIAGGALAADKPNIVFILTDNLGYGEVGCYGGASTASPRAVFDSST